MRQAGHVARTKHMRYAYKIIKKTIVGTIFDKRI